MEGEPWVDAVMQPLAHMERGPGTYNRIYEAVARGTPMQGDDLIRAIEDLVDRNSNAEHVERRMQFRIHELNAKIRKYENAEYMRQKVADEKKAYGRGNRI